MHRPDPNALRRTRAIIEHHLDTLDRDPAPYRLHLCMAEGEQSAGTWLAPRSLRGDELVDIADVMLVPCHFSEQSQWVALHMAYEPEASIVDLVPDTFGADDRDLVQRWRDVIGHIGSPPLQRLIDRVWMRRRVFRDFWRAPASRAHHHAYRGGLASHSIEVAEGIADTRSLQGSDRDIGIAYALLHDIGKLWCFQGTGMTPLGHELLGLTQLGSALDMLHHDWPDGATAMRSLLSGLWKARGQKPLLAVGKLVQAQDQLSAERDLRPRRGHRHRPWIARPNDERAAPSPF